MNDVSLRRQAAFWVAGLVVLVLFIFLFRSILLPFVAGMALAYILDPVADRLQRLGLSRLLATIVILLMFVVIFALALMIIVPVLVTQTADFIDRLPRYVTQLQALVTSPDFHFMPKWLSSQMGSIKDSFSQAISQGAGFLATLLQQIWNSGKALIDIIALLIVTPVVAFYMLLDWDRMVARVDSWVPRQHVGEVRMIARDIDRAIAGFVRGQGSLCLILGCYYAIGLSVVGPEFRAADRLLRRADQLHSLCRLVRRAGARDRRGARPVLAALSVDRRWWRSSSSPGSSWRATCCSRSSSATASGCTRCG